LTSRVGAIAERNACIGPWQPSLDFQLNWRPRFWGLDGKLALSLITVNLLRGIDELLHGSDGAKGWGTPTRPDGTLLYVTGFDPITQQFTYQVNQRFGATGGSATAFRPPFQIGIQARVTFGPDRRQAALDALRRGRGRPGGGVGPGGLGPGPGGAAGSPEAMLARLEAALPNPAALVLAQQDSIDLGLSVVQVAQLETERDSLSARMAVRIERIRSILDEQAQAPEPGRLLQAVRPIFAEARADVVAVHASVQAILTTEQWDRLPEAIRDLARQMPRPGARR
jgi:hypothetical protein